MNLDKDKYKIDKMNSEGLIPTLISGFNDQNNR